MMNPVGMVRDGKLIVGMCWYISSRLLVKHDFGVNIFCLQYEPLMMYHAYGILMYTHDLDYYRYALPTAFL
jgi:hypothetical protein